MALSICVYCGSGNGKDPRYVAAAETLGRMIATGGHRLVYGGGNMGLMGTVARAARDGGAQVTGIIPHFLVTKEKILESTEGKNPVEIVFVDDMHQRKMQMFERADAFVALAGGIGTLEELVEQMTWAQLGRHNKPIVMVDTGGFWRPMMDLLAHMRMEGFIRDGLEVRTLTAEKTEDVIPMIEAWVARHGKDTPAVNWSAKLM